MTLSAISADNYRVAPEKLNLAQNVLDDTIARGCGVRTALVGEFGVVTITRVQQRVQSWPPACSIWD
jgi:hypothetical protein